MERSGAAFVGMFCERLDSTVRPRKICLSKKGTTESAPFVDSFGRTKLGPNFVGSIFKKVCYKTQLVLWIEPKPRP
jgi:hypothetical protein